VRDHTLKQDSTGLPERPSKTQRKKSVQALQSLGESLAELNADQLAALVLPEDLREALFEARTVKSHEAHRRHLQYIGRLMREVDPGPIMEKLAQWSGRSNEHSAREHAIARWRERMMEGDEALTELAAQYPGTDMQRIRLLVRNARAEREAARPPRNYRELFRALREALTSETELRGKEE
jgi:ribosome-associated protein